MVGAALVVSSLDYAKKIGRGDAVRVAAISTVTPTYASSVVEMPDLATDSGAVVDAQSFRAALPKKAYEEAGVSPADVSLAEVYDLSTALELDWMEDLQLCEPGQAAQLLRAGETRVGGRIPINASGGLACFGEAVPAQAISQVCELTWQLRGQAEGRQVENAKVGITANQGLFGPRFVGHSEKITGLYCRQIRRSVHRFNHHIESNLSGDLTPLRGV